MIELQRALLADNIRNEAFYDALKKVIRKGKSTVADIGSGTGFLSFIAARLGAKKCYLYEYDDLLVLSRKIAAVNKISNCIFVHKHSSDVQNPVRADIVISETLGNFALEEHIIENMNDAHERFRRPGGTLIPRALSQFVVPIVSPRIMKEINVWDDVGFGVDLGPARNAALNNMYVQKIGERDFGGADLIKKWDGMDFSKPVKSVRSGSAQWNFAVEMTVYGFGVWWEAELAAGITLSTSPLEKRTHWDQIFLPLEKPLHVQKGDILKVTIKSDSRHEVGLSVSWEAQLARRGKTVERREMDMRRGFN